MARNETMLCSNKFHPLVVLTLILRHLMKNNELPNIEKFFVNQLQGPLK